MMYTQSLGDSLGSFCYRNNKKGNRFIVFMTQPLPPSSYSMTLNLYKRIARLPALLANGAAPCPVRQPHAHNQGHYTR